MGVVYHGLGGAKPPHDRVVFTYLPTMGQERFSSLALLNIECDLTAALIPEDLVVMYANSGKRRLQLS